MKPKRKVSREQFKTKTELKEHVLCGVCKEEQPKWKVHNEAKGVIFCRDCISHFRALAKANKRDYFDEMNRQIDYVKTNINKPKIKNSAYKTKTK